jgi:hypothetical protein
MPTPRVKKTVKKPDIRLCVRASTYAAGAEIVTIEIHAMSTRHAVFRAAWPNPLPFHALAQFSKWRCVGGIQGAAKISRVVLNEEKMMNRNMNMSAAIIAHVIAVPTRLTGLTRRGFRTLGMLGI